MTDTLTISNLTTSDAGSYSVMVTNAYGSTISSNAFLSVLMPGLRPLLNIVSPVAKLVVSNATFTATGAATGAGVSNVLYSLNLAAWTNAVSTNGWANWSATLPLIPGTNVFSACAVNTNGVRSLTNTVKFVYYLTGVLTVRTNGNGSIAPAYNGTALQLGVNYSLTATAGKGTPKGFGFQNWTDGNSNILSGRTMLKFMMASNLVLTANFGDDSPPTIQTKTFTASTNHVLGEFVLHGSAGDNVAVTNVQYHLNSDAWRSAVTTNHWTNWDAVVSLSPGANVFYAYSVDSSSNVSQVMVIDITYNTAPPNVGGQLATVTDSIGNDLFTIGLGKNIFSQSASDTNSLNAVGTYSFLSSGGSGLLKFKYAAPPIAAKRGGQTYTLTFQNTNQAAFVATNIVATNYLMVVTNNNVVSTNVIYTNLVSTSYGYMYFSPVTNRVLGNILNQLIWKVSDTGDGRGLLLQKNGYTAQTLLAVATNGGSYSYTPYPPLGALFKLTATNGTTYLITSFADTNYGSYYEENYDASGRTNKSAATGIFLVASQRPGGNAPQVITNKNFEIFSGTDSFNQQFGAATYSQDTLSTNFDNAVGNYTYAPATTNIGALNLTVTAPPTLAGSNSAARLIFVSGNGGFFTNEDGTFSSFVMTSVTNLAPASVTNTTLNLTNSSSGYVNQIRFLGDGNFTFNGATNGFFTVTNYSPGSLMVNINFTDASNVVTGVDWLQLNYKSAGSGNFFVNEFTNNVFEDNLGGTFGLH